VSLSFIIFTSITDSSSLATRRRLYNSTGFFFLCWAAHYLPFYLMGRQLFLHHYLPAHLASCLVTGALVEFIFNVDPVIDDEVVNARKDELKKKVPEKAKRAFQTANDRLKGQSLLTTWAAAGVIMAAVLWGWWFFLPLTYGKPGLSVEEVNARKWLNYDLHFAK
jgi:dolichyl-phosphate-mannose-protein mannosyltransferase